MRPAGPLLLGVLALTLAHCGDGGPADPRAGRRVQIVAGGGSDTVDTRFTVIAEARGPDAQPAAGVEVVFRASRLDGDSTARATLALLRPPCCYGRLVRDTTDRDGRATVTVLLGPAAGDGLVVVGAPGFGVSDTARFTTKPGAPVGIAVSPRDRPIVVDGSYQIDANLVDRLQNPVPGIPTFSTASTAIQLSPAGLVQGHFVGRARVAIQIGVFSDSAFTSVVPRATLAMRDYSGYVGDSTGYAQMDLDGSHYRRIVNTDVMPIEYSPSNALAPQWIPGTGRLIHLRPVDGALRLFVVDTSGAAHRLIGSPGGITSEADPDVSVDGAWVYFVGHSAEGDDLWRVVSGGGVPEKLTPSPAGIQLRSPSVSPGGNELVYVAAMFAGDVFHAFVRDLSTGATRQLSANEAAGTRWSPTGEWILYAVSGPWGGYSGHMHLVRPDGSDDHELIDGAYYPGGTWSPDGRYVLIVRAEVGTYPELIDVAATMRLPLVSQRAWYGPAWRP